MNCSPGLVPSSILVLTLLGAPGRIGAQRPADEAQPARGTEKTRRVAVGDVHGDYQTFRRLLGRLGIIDAEGRWAGGDQHLIQTGDIVDRGPDSRRAVELLMRLEEESRSAGGRVTVLLGNHEVMNLTGDLTYTVPGEFLAFAADESAELRNERLDRILALCKKGSDLLRSDYYPVLSRQLDRRRLERYFPKGYFAHRDAFSPRGRMGKWLLGLPIVFKDGDTLFVHGGLSPRVAKLSAAAINRTLAAELRAFLDTVDELARREVVAPDLGFAELYLLVASERRAGGPHPDIEPLFARLEQLQRESLLFAADGPVWYRGLAENDERAFEDSVTAILRLQQVERIVIGHTQPKSLRIEGRFANRVMLIDTGMNQQVYGGRPSALIFEPSGKVEFFE
jgi:hypothetical protein